MGQNHAGEDHGSVGTLKETDRPRQWFLWRAEAPAGDHSPRAVPSRIGLRRAKSISCASLTPPGSPSATAALAGPHHRPTRPAADARSLTPAAPGGGGIRRAVAVRDELDPSPLRGGVRAPGSAAEPLPRP